MLLDAIKRMGGLQMREVRGADHDLGGHAANVHTGPADLTGLDEGDAGTLLCGADGGGKCCSAATDDRDVDRLAIAIAVLPTVWTYQRSR